MHFVQDTKSASILSQFGINQSIVCGDTRIDRVLERSKNVVIDQKITEWIDGSDKVIVFGRFGLKIYLLSMVLLKDLHHINVS